MTTPPDDQMWPEFQPLWAALNDAGGLLVAGGYGLYLKQHWLMTERTIQTVIPLEQWADQNPRVTKDLDLIIALDLIASEVAQERMSSALRERGFEVAAKNPRWQFEKLLAPNKKMLVDLHAALPAASRPNLAQDKIRVKHNPSLGDSGVHGRQNAEAAGSEHHPCRLEIGGIGIDVPNPVTWSVMKLVAMRDQFERSAEVSREQRDREFRRQQAIKHAHDVCRVVAMMTRDEQPNVAGVIAAIRNTDRFSQAAKIRDTFFTRGDGWAAEVVRRAWRSDDLELIRGLLADWFR